MQLILTGLILTAALIGLIGLAILRTGIQVQDRSASLTCQPPSLAAAIARRVLGLYSSVPATGVWGTQADRVRPCLSDGKERRAS